jgi:hypothetical protein
MYAVTFENVAVTAAQDFVSLLPATQKPIVVHAVYLSQSTELGDAAEEQLRVTIVRGNTTVGSGGGAFTPLALNPSDAAAGTSARINDTTPASAGTAVTLHAETFNVRAGWVYLPTPECRPVCKNAEFLCIRLLANPIDSITMGGTVLFEEI